MDGDPESLVTWKISLYFSSEGSSFSPAPDEIGVTRDNVQFEAVEHVLDFCEIEAGSCMR
jgi:hypothetical protein